MRHHLHHYQASIAHILCMAYPFLPSPCCPAPPPPPPTRLTLSPHPLLLLPVTTVVCIIDNLPSPPFQVLNQTSAWWMSKTEHIVKNALISTPDPNIAVMKNCEVFPVEFVCRGFMTGGWTLMVLQNSHTHARAVHHCHSCMPGVRSFMFCMLMYCLKVA